MRVEEVGPECKAYWECVVRKEIDCVARQDCPYPDCGRRHAWYWGWYYREEGKEGTTIPYGDDGSETACKAIPIRRFYCPHCGRTFSWRPRFLVFGRRHATVAYQLALESWIGHSVPQPPRWWFLSPRARGSLFGWLRARFGDLLARIREELDAYNALVPTVDDERINLWNGALHLTEIIGSQENPRLPFHFLCLALARHPYGFCYSLASA